MFQLQNYVGFTCDACGHTWEQDFRTVASGVQCPECKTLQDDGPDMQVIFGELPEENGRYECYACGHTFGYTASRNENPDETPDCTHCSSSNVGRIY